MLAKAAVHDVGEPMCLRAKARPPLRAGLRIVKRRCPRTALAVDGAPELDYVEYSLDGYPAADGFPMSHAMPHDSTLYNVRPALVAALLRRGAHISHYSDVLIHWREPNPRWRRALGFGRRVIGLGRRSRRRGGSRNFRVRSICPDFYVVPRNKDDPRLPSYRLFHGVAKLQDAMQTIDEAKARAPLFVLEVLSKTTADRDRRGKRRIYQNMRVPEYWLFDPWIRFEPVGLVGLELQEGRYEEIPPVPGTDRYPSAYLGVEFHVEPLAPKGAGPSAAAGGKGPVRKLVDRVEAMLPSGVVPGRDPGLAMGKLRVRNPETGGDHPDLDEWIASGGADRERADVAEQQALASDQRADAAEQQALASDQRADAAEQQALASDQRADAAERRAEAAEAEIARLRRQLEGD